MKKTVKRILVLLLAVTLCLGFTGCKELDRAREHHALLQADGTLLLNGTTYVPLPYCEEFTPPMGLNYEIVTVTAPDVPVLLKDFVNEDYYSISEDRRVVGGGGTYFCLEEDAARLTAMIEEGFTPAAMEYTYTVYDPKEGEADWKEKTYRLTEEQKNAVYRVLASAEPREAESISGEYSVSLQVCSEDGWFSRYICDLYLYNGLYSLVIWGDSNITLYDVPAEMNDVFAGIMSVYIESAEAYWNEWE